MRLPPNALRCVVFIGCLRKGVFSPKGTAFLVRYLTDPKPWDITYVVTARHVIERVRELSDDAKVYIRLNSTEVEGSAVFETPNDSWVFHDDSKVDVAVATLPLPKSMDHSAIKFESLATKEILDRHKIGPGNELFFPGLFVHHQGEAKSLPIVGRGTIAAMPTDKVSTKTLGWIDAYLIEARSIGGLSGSPVFVNLGPLQIGPPDSVYAQFGLVERPEIAHIKFGPTFLLGLIHGHFGVQDILDTDEDWRDNESRSVNMGIGIVVPAIKIVEMLTENQTIIEMRGTLLRNAMSQQQSLGDSQGK